MLPNTAFYPTTCALLGLMDVVFKNMIVVQPVV
jgi:hypothetical protein